MVKEEPMTNKRGYVVGSPIRHSRSPDIHNSAYRALGLDWEYEAIEVPKDGLGAFLATIKPSETSVISVTMPLKLEAAALANTRSPLVDELGIANTLLPRDGRWFADNTDVAGLERTITSTEHEFGSGGSATVLGTGATALSTIRALSNLGFGQLLVCGRDPSALKSCAELAGSLRIEVEVFDVSRLGGLLDSKLVVSTWPSEVAGELAAPLLGSRAGGLGLLVDVTYSPWPSSLASAWFSAGGDVVGGLELLVNQAIGQVEAATGSSAPLQAMREAVDLPRPS